MLKINYGPKLLFNAHSLNFLGLIFIFLREMRIEEERIEAEKKRVTNPFHLFLDHPFILHPFHLFLDLRILLAK